MITKIESITNFGIYKNFNWNTDLNIDDFRSKNIIYGWNYSGKTTLSRLFSSLRDKKIHDDFLTGNFKTITENGNFDKVNITDFPYEVMVFNSDYIKDNLSWEFDVATNAIFFEVGDNAIYEKRIIELNVLLDEINGSNQKIGLKNKFLEIIKDFESFENTKFTNEAKNIKNESFISLIDFDKRTLKTIKEKVAKNIKSHIINDKKELNRLSKIIKIDKPKSELDEVIVSLNIKELTTEINKLLLEVPVKTDVVKILDENKDAFDWVKNGLNLNKESEKCIFCDNEIEEKRFVVLNNFFENQASKLKEKSFNLFENINIEEIKINNISFPNSSNDFNQGYQDEYLKVKKEIDKLILNYQKHLSILKKKLNYKIDNSIYSIIPIVVNYEIQKIEDKFLELNEIIRQNNKFTKEFVNIISIERNKYKNHLVASFLKTEKYFVKENKYKRALISIEKFEEKILKLNKEIVRYTSLKESDLEGALQFNSFVQSFLNREDIEIKLNQETKKFRLLRNNESAKNLSEGEKTAIAFSHFLVTLKSIELKNRLLEYIIFIDDPISSLDGNHIFQINSLLKETFFSKESITSKWELKCKQLFISTHNFEFFTLLKEMPTTNGFRYSKKDKSNESRYFIERGLADSKILKLPNVYDSYSSEYHFLFSEIIKFDKEVDKGNSEKLLLIPNILRRFVEMYTLTKCPSDDPFDERANIVFGKTDSKRILKPLHYFSHFDNIDRIGKQSDLIADLPVACQTLLQIIKKDVQHYNALLKAIS